MKILNVVIAILQWKIQYLSQNIDFVSDVKPVRWQITIDVVYEVGFPTIYRSIYCRKLLTLSNQTSPCIRKCIKIDNFQMKARDMDCWYTLHVEPMLLLEQK